MTRTLHGWRLGWLAALLSVCCMWLASPLGAAEVMPPAPPRYFNDFAGVTRGDTQSRLNQSLEQFEKDTSSQIVIAVFQKMESDSSIEDYVNRMFKAWKIGQQQKNNGVLLAVFVQDRKMRIEVGYGLEGVIPDAIARRIIDNELKPRFRNNDFDGGLSAAANALMQAARGEYKGTGRTAASFKGSVNTLGLGLLCPLIFMAMIFFGIRRSFRGTMYRGRGSSGWGAWPIIMSSGWGDGGGSSGGDSGGSFSGGGGDSGGGGASGSW